MKDRLVQGCRTLPVAKTSLHSDVARAFLFFRVAVERHNMSVNHSTMPSRRVRTPAKTQFWQSTSRGQAVSLDGVLARHGSPQL